MNKLKRAAGSAARAASTAARALSDGAQAVPQRLKSRVEEFKGQHEPHGEEVKAENLSDATELALRDYNEAHAELQEAGRQLLSQRERTADLIRLVQVFVNSIARTPKEFGTAFEEIESRRRDFRSVLNAFDADHVAALRKDAMGAAAGVAAGAGVAGLAPGAAMWVATTFGTASTGTAISSLSGAAATNAALAWLGGGALATGGGGTTAGTAFLALAGPVGWSIAGAALVGSAVFTAVHATNRRNTKKQALTDIKTNTASVRSASAQVTVLVHKTTELRERLSLSLEEALPLSGGVFAEFSHDQQRQLASMVNNTLSAAELLGRSVNEARDDA
ncbi:hypothetical protein [Galactobacter valiniphilus]|uniref:hypothetical protein n=1 Tax=Galactobacter valiniphilus TaxID=2676122 RepID=UPI003736C0FC